MGILKYQEFSLEASHQDPFKGVNLALADALALGVIITDTEGRCVYSNKVYQALCGWTAEELKGSYWSSVIHPLDHALVVMHWRESLLKRSPFQCEARLKRADGEDVWTRRHISTMDDGMPGHVYVHTVEDISVQKAREASRIAAEESLIDHKAREQLMLDFVGDGLICTDTEGQITYLNRVAESLTGFSREEAVGRPLRDVFWVLEADTREPRPDPAQRAIDCESAVGLYNNVVLVTRSGEEMAIEDAATPILNRKNEVVGAVIMFHDTRYSSDTIAKLAHLAQHDPLTGLFNRHGLSERFDQALALARRHDKQMGIIFIDLDKFKSINDALGHTIGDRVLEELANRLLSCVRATDTVCRYGGDEFVVLLNEVAEPDHAVAVADKVREAVASALLSMDGKQISVQLSIGVSVYPDNGETLGALLHHADVEMYRMKMSGKQTSKKKAFTPLRANGSRFKV